MLWLVGWSMRVNNSILLERTMKSFKHVLLAATLGIARLWLCCSGALRPRAARNGVNRSKTNLLSRQAAEASLRGV